MSSLVAHNEPLEFARRAESGSLTANCYRRSAANVGREVAVEEEEALVNESS